MPPTIVYLREPEGAEFSGKLDGYNESFIQLSGAETNLPVLSSLIKGDSRNIVIPTSNVQFMLTKNGVKSDNESDIA